MPGGLRSDGPQRGFLFLNRCAIPLLFVGAVLQEDSSLAAIMLGLR